MSVNCNPFYHAKNGASVIEIGTGMPSQDARPPQHGAPCLQSDVSAQRGGVNKNITARYCLADSNKLECLLLFMTEGALNFDTPSTYNIGRAYLF